MQQFPAVRPCPREGAARRTCRTLGAGSVLLVGILVAAPGAAGAAGAGTVRVSVSTQGVQGIGVSGNSLRNQAVSADGRVVAFYSQAENLSAHDTNLQPDVIVRDLNTGRTTRASVSSGGVAANSFSYAPSLDGAGRRVAFVSFASNLVPGDTNGSSDVFVRDRRAGTTTRVDVTGSGAQIGGGSASPSISANGRVVAFESTSADLLPAGQDGFLQVFAHDLVTGRTVLVSATAGGAAGNGDSGRASVSADGSHIAFESTAANLVRGDTNAHCDGNGCTSDAFVRDLTSGTTVRVDVRPDGAQAVRGAAPSISADGTKVAMLGNGLLPGHTSSRDEVFVRNLTAGTTTLVRSTDGTADGTTGPPALSGDGRTVAFSSGAALVTGDTNRQADVYVHSLATGALSRVSTSSAGAQGNSFSTDPAVNGDGSRVVYVSYATNLVPADTNGDLDVFLHTS